MRRLASMLQVVGLIAIPVAFGWFLIPLGILAAGVELLIVGYLAEPESE